MFIEPNTNIRLLKSVPLDTTYKHTLYFGSVTAQTNYFIGLTKYNMERYTYQRVQKGSARVGIKADLLYDCNYMMFQNTSFGTKWFYAFITGVEYINNEVSEITFEIDVMQTWYFDYNLRECFVEREHSITDAVGDNLVPENVDMGDYVSEDFDGTNVVAQKSIVVAATFNKEYTSAGGGMYGGIYSGLVFNVFDNSTAGVIEATEFIQGAGARANEIVAVFYAPKNFIAENLESAKSVEITKPKLVSNMFTDYTIKNNKLYTYPFNFLYVSNLQGNSTAFPYEYFSGEECEFIVGADTTCNPSVILAPQNYKGVIANYDEKMSLTGYPQCAYNTDSFKQWLAQNALTIPLSLVSAGIGVYTGGLSASVAKTATASSIANANAVGGGVSQIGGVLNSGLQSALSPFQSHGSSGNATMCALGLLDFAFMHKHIRKEFAQIIDDYFSMYGYATHRVKVPNISSRPHWNYVKTIDCVIVGSVPADDMRKICGIYDSGITFWKNGANVGNYSLDNSPTSTSGASEISDVEPADIESEVSVATI